MALMAPVTQEGGCGKATKVGKTKRRRDPKGGDKVGTKLQPRRWKTKDKVFSRSKIAKAVKEPTPLPNSLDSWEGDANRLVDFSTISKLLPDFSATLKTQMESSQKERQKALGLSANKKERKDKVVFHSQYMKNKGRRKMTSDETRIHRGEKKG